MTFFLGAFVCARHFCGRLNRNAMVSKSPGPHFKRHALVKLEDINVDSSQTGHRPKDIEFIATLKEKFLDGDFGRTVTCGVQILDEEEFGRKLIDDGLSTVCALLQIQDEVWKVQGAKKPDGEPWDSQLVDIFTNGLAVNVVKYADDTDRDAREAWNLMKHDKESLAVSWSTVFGKINIARKRYVKTPNWVSVRRWLHESVGGGSASKDSINRWVRAASQMDGEVVDAMKDLKWLPGKCVWDNEYLMGNAAKARSKMAPTTAVKALRLLAQSADQETPAVTFVDKICMPMKVLEVWQCLLIKRFGAVASNSSAVRRLVASLETKAGLQSVVACAKASVLLHSPTGIPECVTIFEELARCHAGGLPPPAEWPMASEEEKRKSADAKKQKEDDEAEARARANDESAAMELDILALASPGLPEADGAPGVSAGALAKAVDALQEDLKRVKFSSTVSNLIDDAKASVQSTSRTSLVLDFRVVENAVFMEGVAYQTHPYRELCSFGQSVKFIF